MRTSLLFFFLGLTSLILASCTPPLPQPKDKPLLDFSNSGMTITNPTYGSGAHTITIFSDFQCPACIAFHNAYDELLQSYASENKLTLVYKQFPLYPIPHENALRDAYAALCAQEQGKYIEFANGMYALEQEKKNARVSDAERGIVAQGAGVPNLGQFNSCLANDTYAKQVYLDREKGNEKNIPGTPTIFFDGIRLEPTVYGDPTVFQKFLAEKTAVSE